MYSIWAARRRNAILFWFTACCIFALAVYLLVSMYEPPSCFDGKFNQDELATDCGGICDRLCSSQIEPLSVAWAGSFEVSNGMWSAFAYVNNPNTTAYASNLEYRFILYDREGEVITTVDGSTAVTHTAILPVFEGRTQVGDKMPYRTDFMWLTEGQVWYKNVEYYDVVTQEQSITNVATKPEIRATVVNKTPHILNDVYVYAVVYDVNKNAIATSKTYIDTLTSRGRRNITFNWPNPFAGRYERMELIVQVPQQEE